MPKAKLDHGHFASQRKIATKQLAKLYAKVKETDGYWPNDDSFGYFVGIIETLAQSLESLSGKVADLEKQADQLG